MSVNYELCFKDVFVDFIVRHIILLSISVHPRWINLIFNLLTLTLKLASKRNVFHPSWITRDSPACCRPPTLTKFRSFSTTTGTHFSECSRDYSSSTHLPVAYKHTVNSIILPSITQYFQNLERRWATIKCSFYHLYFEQFQEQISSHQYFSEEQPPCHRIQVVPQLVHGVCPHKKWYSYLHSKRNSRIKSSNHEIRNH